MSQDTNPEFELGESAARDILDRLDEWMELDIEETRAQLLSCGNDDTRGALLVFVDKETKERRAYDHQDRLTLAEALALVRM